LANGPRWLWAVLLAVLGSIVFFSARQSRRLKRSEADLFITQLEAMVLARLPNVSVESLAQASGISLRTFYRRMEDQGTKPGEFLREIRLKQARSLLEENEGMQVAEVAKHVGYSEAHLRRLLDEGPDA
jgi:transcriptional regulator GlxA family with amidase domain